MALEFLAGINWGGGLMTFLKWFIPPILIGLGAYFVWWYFGFNIQIEIHKAIGNGSISEGKDKGKKIRDRKNNDVKGFQLLKNKSDWSGENIPEEFFQPIKKTFGIGYKLHMIRDEEGNLQPIAPPNKNSIKMWDGMRNSDKLWAMSAARDAIRAYATRENKYDWLHTAAPYIGLILVVVLMLVLMKQMEGVVAGLNGIASQLNNVNMAAQVVS